MNVDIHCHILSMMPLVHCPEQSYPIKTDRGPVLDGEV